MLVKESIHTMESFIKPINTGICGWGLAAQAGKQVVIEGLDRIERERIYLRDCMKEETQKLLDHPLYNALSGATLQAIGLNDAI